MKTSHRPGLISRLTVVLTTLLVLLSIAVPTAPIALAATGSIAEYPLPRSYSGPVGITSGPDGNLWFTEAAGNRIGRITPSGSITEYPLPRSHSGPAGITSGPDGNLWFAEAAGNRIGRITLSGSITEYSPPRCNNPVWITSGPDGNLWFTETIGNRIGRITPGGSITEFALPTAESGPAGIVTGPDGNLWFTEAAGNKIGRITPGGSIAEYPLPTAKSGPVGIASGPNGNLWFTEAIGNKIGLISPGGTITEFALPTAKSGPTGIMKGADGNLWFTEAIGNKVGRITPGGSITEYPLPSAKSGPTGIVAGPDSNGWFTEATGNKIGRITIVVSVPPPTLTVSPASLDPTNTTNCALDATLSSTYKCTVTLGKSSTSQGNANWSATSSLSGVTFSPASGTLNPGGSTPVTIDAIPCQNGTFTFSGKEGETPVSVTWTCTPPTLTVSPTSLNNAMCSGAENASQCTVTLGETSTSQGNVNWATSGDLSGVSFSPSTGTLSPGNSATITISAIPCQKGTFTFKGSGGASPVSVTWMCDNWPMFGYDPEHTHFNPNEHGLSTSNVSGLVADWKKPTGGGIGYSSPAVVNNLVYIGSSDGNLYALNAASGAVVWSYYVASPTSPAEANGVVYIGSQDHYYGLAGLYALNAQTGALLWKNNPTCSAPRRWPTGWCTLRGIRVPLPSTPLQGQSSGNTAVREATIPTARPPWPTGWFTSPRATKMSMRWTRQQAHCSGAITMVTPPSARRR